MSSCVYAMGKSTPGDQSPAARSSHPLLRSNLSHIFFTRELISVTIFLPFSVARDWRLNYCLIAGGGWLLFASVCISLHHLSYGTAFSLYSGVVAGIHDSIFSSVSFFHHEKRRKCRKCWPPARRPKYRKAKKSNESRH